MTDELLDDLLDWLRIPSISTGGGDPADLQRAAEWAATRVRGAGGTADLVTIDGVRVVGLGGTFAPSWYETPADALPHPRKGTAKATELADKRRHFVKEEVDRCRAMSGIDVFLSHEAARPYRVHGTRGPDAGKTPINEVLASLEPRLHLFGHHHRFTAQIRQGVRSVGLDLVARSYLLVDGATLEYEQMQTEEMTK